MGAWGHGHFENDTALDWIADLAMPKKYFFGLIKSDPISRCLETVTPVIDTKYVEAEIACELLAAAECNALVRGHPALDLPEEVLSWYELIKELKTQAHDDDINQWVVEAVQRVKNSNESELDELWKETDDYSLWLSTVDDLLNRLRLTNS